MSVYTEYDRLRDELKCDLENCLEKAKELMLGTKIWGYDHMKEDYAEELYFAIKNAIKKV